MIKLEYIIIQLHIFNSYQQLHIYTCNITVLILVTMTDNQIVSNIYKNVIAANLDKTIRCNDGEIKVCSMVLKSRSKYFKNTFGDDFRQNNSFVYNDFSMLEMEIVLDHIYFRKPVTEKSLYVLVRLLEVARYFGLDDLTNEIELILLDKCVDDMLIYTVLDMYNQTPYPNMTFINELMNNETGHIVRVCNDCDEILKSNVNICCNYRNNYSEMVIKGPLRDPPKRFSVKEPK